MKLVQTRKGLALQYGVHTVTIKKWLRTIGISHRGGLTPMDVEIFVQKIGKPLNPDILH